ncbi:acetyl-CoA synthetase-like protein [Mytilinidion resinicola]|uniref:Acetyl-CoA synthetase-like protein n=1 Tax=Mytilinidion resinicola TaxID=574789 RepID=A0A6A6XYM2_9PEZI|nr:acetyl-CoA synthetase-like protein [Mytilinidion resinicola]KAF2801353.1 acetyl-CoA synthetase-like protein [Mytilinidion resinicola]
MNLVNAIYTTFFTDRFHMDQYVILHVYTCRIARLEEIIFTRLAQGYTDSGFGVSHYIAERSNSSLMKPMALEKGDVLALYTPNCIDTPALHDFKAKPVVTQKSFLEKTRAAARKAGIADNRVILMGDKRDETQKFKHFRGMTRYRESKIDPKKDLAFLVYSSGTTGLPKGVMLSHENIVANTMMNQVGEGKDLSWKGGFNNGGDKILAFIPFFHIYLVVMTKFELDRFCQNVQTRKITYTYAVPPVILMLGKSPIIDKYDLSSLRILKSGRPPLKKGLTDALYKRLGIPIKQGYSLSETSPTTHMQHWEDWHVHIGSVGRLLPNQTAKYIHDFEIEVPFGETGELCIKGPNVFQGYLNNPASTTNAFTRDGYLRPATSGTRIKMPIYITDRVKELIKYKGFQVPPPSSKVSSSATTTSRTSLSLASMKRRARRKSPAPTSSLKEGKFVVHRIARKQNKSPALLLYKLLRLLHLRLRWVDT